MKKSTLILAALFASMAVSAKTITLDLSQPTDPTSFVFNENDVWESTCDSSVQSFEAQIFAFSKSLDGRSYGGTSWNGFTVSKATTGDYYANYQKGGLKGEGSSYVLAYYNEWWLIDPKNEDATSSNMIIFNDGEAYYPRYVYLNNVLISYSDIMNGNDFGGRAFKRGDKFGVKIEGLDDEFYPDGSEVTYLLADYTDEDSTKWYVNTEWEKVDLTSLGQVYGLQFTVFSTDQGMYGTNTATYFALDGLTVSDVEPLKVATFEDVTIAEPESVLHLTETGAIKSGDFYFTQEVSASEWGTYYYGNVPTNKTSNEYKGDWQNDMSASGGAYEGANFIVWTSSYSGLDGVTIDHADVVPGFFVNNTPWVVDAILNGDGMSSDGAAPFSAEDYFTLTITATLNGVAVNNEVKVDLAAEGKYINQWTYVDLSALGEVDALHFALTGSKHNDYGLTTPAYFAMDNFGAEMPEDYVAPEQAEIPAEEGIEDTEVAVKAVKVLRNGQLSIVRGEAEYTVTGLRVK